MFCKPKQNALKSFAIAVVFQKKDRKLRYSKTIFSLMPWRTGTATIIINNPPDGEGSPSY